MTQLATRARGESAAQPRGRSRNRTIRRGWFGWLLVAPTLAVLVITTAFPLVYNAWNSVHHYDLSDGLPHRFVGASNYRQLAVGHSFFPALVNTLEYTAASVTLELMVGLGLAVLLHREFRGRGLLRAALLVPWAVPTVVAATLWKSMFDQSHGFVNLVLTDLHLPGAHLTWLNVHVWSSWAAILITDAWQSVPLVAILLLAGLQAIPTDVYEAVRIDGASAWQSFRHITWPLLRPAVMVTVVFRTLSALLIFDVIYVLTTGGPGDKTQTLSFLDYQAFIQNNNFGYGGAISLSMLVAAVAIAFVMRRLLASRI
jgi:multiple sugar transport system permease protein